MSKRRQNNNLKISWIMLLSEENSDRLVLCFNDGISIPMSTVFPPCRAYQNRSPEENSHRVVRRALLYHPSDLNPKQKKWKYALADRHFVLNNCKQKSRYHLGQKLNLVKITRQRRSENCNQENWLASFTTWRAFRTSSILNFISLLKLWLLLQNIELPKKLRIMLKVDD